MPPHKPTDDIDARVRLAAFSFLEEQSKIHGEILDRTLLQQGFDFDGTRVPLLGPQGIFKPAILPEMPISITTVPVELPEDRPYNDEVDAQGRLRYRYCGTEPKHRDNVGLRLAMSRQQPIIYMYGVVKSRYMPVWPAYVVGDDPAGLAFTVELDVPESLFAPPGAIKEDLPETRRHYITTQVRQRIHQRSFRERVLLAYHQQCAICRLRHEELLEAAHIIPDSHPKGEPVVSNGLALCKLHHAAYDRHIIGVTPKLKVEVRLDVLQEKDGPMLEWGLQHFHEASLFVPRRQNLQPNRDFLAERYEIFRRAH